MSCCPYIQQSFVNQSTVIIPYGAIQKELYGEQPNVQVYYRDGLTYRLSDDMNEVKVTPSQVTVDLGGPATGFIKIF